MKFEIGKITPFIDSGSRFATDRFVKYIENEAEKSEAVISEEKFPHAVGVEKLLRGVLRGNLRNSLTHKDIRSHVHSEQLEGIRKGNNNFFTVDIIHDRDHKSVVIAQALIKLVLDTDENEIAFFDQEERSQIYTAVQQVISEMSNQPFKYYGEAV